MEHQQVNESADQGGIGKNTNTNTNTNTGFLCRQSSTRWTPTTDQIRILKELYYNNGVRSPTAEQIQRISAKLRQYGKIEGKNVFYWFQNHKARERQKKRFTAHEIPMHHHITRPSSANAPNIDHHIVYTNFSNNMYPLLPPPPPAAATGNFGSSSSASSTPGLMNAGSYGYGSMNMEESFREISITQGANVGGQNFAWIGVDPYSSSPYPFLERKTFINQTLEAEEEEEEEEAPLPEIETLPLFPMHDEVRQQTGWHQRADDAMAAGSRASLELTLNSYSYSYSYSYAAAGFN